MPSTRYSYNIDLDNVNTSHALAILSVRPGSRVLDIGAADGSVARVLTERGCRVWGIELDADAARSAVANCEQIVVGDVECLDLDAELGGARFDYVLLLDVLEHLREPVNLLKRARALLVPGGEIIASIPNVAHGAVRLSLLQGAFTYTDTGLLDRTHLCFFDRKAIDALFSAAGLQIRERLRVVRGLTETEIPVDLDCVPPTVLNIVDADSDSTTYQFVIVAAPLDGLGTNRVAGSLAERLQRQLETLERRFREVEGYAKGLEAKHTKQVERLADIEALRTTAANRVDELTLELMRRMDELHRHDLELRHVRLDLAVKEAFVNDLRAEVTKNEEATARLNREIDGHKVAAADLHRELASHEQAAGALRRELVQSQQAAANSARAHEEFISSPGVRWLTRTSRQLRRFPRLGAFVHRFIS